MKKLFRYLGTILLGFSLLIAIFAFKEGVWPPHPILTGMMDGFSIGAILLFVGSLLVDDDPPEPPGDAPKSSPFDSRGGR